MSYFTHRFETHVSRHAVGTYHYSVVYLEAALHSELPLDQHARLRIEADVSGVPVKGAWQPARGRWYLMLPKALLKAAGLKIGSAVEVAFRVLPQDDVDVPEELAARLARMARVRKAWEALSAGGHGVALTGRSSLFLSNLGRATASAGDHARATAILREWERPPGRSSATKGD